MFTKATKAAGEVALLGCVRLVEIINRHKFQQQGTVCVCAHEYVCCPLRGHNPGRREEDSTLVSVSTCLFPTSLRFPPAGLRGPKQKPVFDRTLAVESSSLSMRGCGRLQGAQ